MRRHVSISRILGTLFPCRPRGGTLVVMLSSMGDLLLASGAIRKIADCSDGPTYVVINSYAAPVTGLLALPTVRWVQVGKCALSNMLRLMPIFRRQWDRVVHLTFSTTSYAHVVCDAASAMEKVWFNGDSSDAGEVVAPVASQIYTRIVKVSRDAHELDKMHTLIEALGCAGDGRDGVYPALDPASCKKECDTSHKIAVCPGGRFAAKRWDNRRFAELIKAIAEKMPAAEFILLGGQEDIDACSEIESSVSSVALRNLCGKLSVEASVREIAASKLCIGNDSFALHAAIAVGTPSVVIMGGGDYPRWIPWKDAEQHKMVAIDCDHRGCRWNCVYGDYRCVREITVDDVMREVECLMSKVQCTRCKGDGI